MKKIAKILLLCAMSFVMTKTYAQVAIGVSVRIAPPALPVYVQPACPVDGYLWQPGYWAYDDADGYYWVPGVWVAPPTPGYLWTPPYWGYEGGFYGFHRGYWGLHVGFYGGINYGYGYGGFGFYGGRWAGNRFSYNTAVMHVNRTVIRNTYIDRTVINNRGGRTSFNGPGGVNARPRPQEMAAMRERHIGATSSQMEHQRAALGSRSQFASVNHGRPGATAVDRVSARPFSARTNGRTPNASGFGRSANGPNTNQRQGNRTGFGQQPGRQPLEQQQRQRTGFGQQQGRQPMQQRAPQGQRSGFGQQRPPQQQHLQQAPHMQQQRPAMQPHNNAAPHGFGGGGGGHRH